MLVGAWVVGGDVVGGEVVGGGDVVGVVWGGAVVGVVVDGAVVGVVGTELVGITDPSGGVRLLPVSVAVGNMPSYWGIWASTAAMKLCHISAGTVPPCT